LPPKTPPHCSPKALTPPSDGQPVAFALLCRSSGLAPLTFPSLLTGTDEETFDSRARAIKMRGTPALLMLAAIVGALVSTPALAVGDPLPANSCRTGTPACPNGCCSTWCPNGGAGNAIAKAVPGLQTKIVGLTYSKSKLLLTGTIVVTNTGKMPLPSIILAVMAGASSSSSSGSADSAVPDAAQENMWCGGAKGKPLAPGASRSCPFAILGGVYRRASNWDRAASEPMPGVKPATWQEARAFTNSDVLQTVFFGPTSEPWAYPQVRDTTLYPQAGFPGYICGFASVRAKVVA